MTGEFSDWVVVERAVQNINAVHIDGLIMNRQTWFNNIGSSSAYGDQCIGDSSGVNAGGGAVNKHSVIGNTKARGATTAATD